MSPQSPDSNQPFVSPPPPSPYVNTMYPPDVLATKAALVASDVKSALILAIIGLFCASFIVGYLAFRKANEALQTTDLRSSARQEESGDDREDHRHCRHHRLDCWTSVALHAF